MLSQQELQLAFVTIVVIVFLSLLLVYRSVRHLDRFKHRAF